MPFFFDVEIGIVLTRSARVVVGVQRRGCGRKGLVAGEEGEGSSRVLEEGRRVGKAMP